MSDTCGERLPVVRDAGCEEDGGRGLVLVAALAEEWGTAPRAGAPGKTVWAVVPTAVPVAPAPGAFRGQGDRGRTGKVDVSSGTGP
ncbi:hypothetical protein RKE30_04385 [Streptomyces sp. Li-HN-5-11]|uniref:hypothetical protein n=1 Tax=Streptomyces sp. Li-HN-5-11 TaxID=3075432 RepID=UPI0028A815D7|nr:hypothetical protein [Streptomyces sp. Li-HN-5-11]WNM29689.1 hypothetical protein RKE30_04385 [Streptomyces sp. Li-HN-5-11]